MSSFRFFCCIPLAFPPYRRGRGRAGSKDEVKLTTMPTDSPEKYENAPIVLQLVGPRKFREDELLGLAEVVERALGRE